jgi:hypothetical protein
MNTARTEHDMLFNLAKKYRDDNYEVEIEPPSSHVPFDLNGYRPDMIAIKGDSKLIIEVKQKIQRVSIERLQEIAKLISQHEGWRFVVMTPDDIENNYLPDDGNVCPTWEELSKQVNKIPVIIESIGNAASLVYIWGLIEAVLRRYAIDLSIPIERLPFTRIAKHLYSIGELSMDELNLLLTTQAIRNKAAHGYHVEITRDELNHSVDFINGMLSNKKVVTG